MNIIIRLTSRTSTIWISFCFPKSIFRIWKCLTSSYFIIYTISTIYWSKTVYLSCSTRGSSFSRCLPTWTCCTRISWIIIWFMCCFISSCCTFISSSSSGSCFIFSTIYIYITFCICLCSTCRSISTWTSITSITYIIIWFVCCFKFSCSTVISTCSCWTCFIFTSSNI